MTDAIVLPDSGDGSRRARRQPARREAPDRREPQDHRPRRRRRRWPFVVLLLLVVVAGATAWFVTRDDTGSVGGSPSSPSPATPALKTSLLIERSKDGRLSAATLLVDDGRGGDVMFLPPGTMVEAPSLGLVPLRDTLDAGAEGLLLATVENLLGTRIGGIADVTVDQLADAMRPASPLRVEVPATIERRTGDRVETVFEPGPTDVTADELSDYLDLPAETDLDRLVRHQTFWQAWLGAMRGGRAAPPSGSLPIAVRQQVTRLAAHDVDYHVLPVKAVSGAEGLYQVERTRLDGLFPRLLPGTPTWARRISVQVLNGTGQPGVAQQLIEPLVDAGARVALTGNADRFGYTATQVVYYDDDHANDARRVRAALGVGEIVKSRSGQRVVAVTVVVGADFRPAPAGTTGTTQGVQP